MVGAVLFGPAECQMVGLSLGGWERARNCEVFGADWALDRLIAVRAEDTLRKRVAGLSVPGKPFSRTRMLAAWARCSVEISDVQQEWPARFFLVGQLRDRYLKIRYGNVIDLQGCTQLVYGVADHSRDTTFCPDDVTDRGPAG